ncbi:MAG: hypothetical protein IKL53_08535 [Lachnospiraceae bacterium]|nr:hypothetical protein [Lachnospiraceae bacterium]
MIDLLEGEENKELINSCIMRMESPELVNALEKLGEVSLRVEGKVEESHLVNKLSWEQEYGWLTILRHGCVRYIISKKKKEKSDEEYDMVQRRAKPYDGLLLTDVSYKLIDEAVAEIDMDVVNGFLDCYMIDRTKFFAFARANVVPILDVANNKQLHVMSDERIFFSKFANAATDINLLQQDLKPGTKVSLDLTISYDADSDDPYAPYDICTIRSINVYDLNEPLAGRDDYKYEAIEYVNAIRENQLKLLEANKKHKVNWGMNKDLFWTVEAFKVDVPEEFNRSDKEYQEYYDKMYHLKNIFGHDEELYNQVLHSLRVKDFFEYVNGFFKLPGEMAVVYRKLYIVEMISIVEALINTGVKNAQNACKCHRKDIEVEEKIVDQDGNEKLIKKQVPCYQECRYFFPTKVYEPVKRNATLIDHIRKMKQYDRLCCDDFYSGWNRNTFIWEHFADDYNCGNYDFLETVYQIRNHIHLGYGRLKNTSNLSEQGADRDTIDVDGMLANDDYVRSLSEILPMLAEAISNYMICDTCHKEYMEKLEEEELEMENAMWDYYAAEYAKFPIPTDFNED